MWNCSLRMENNTNLPGSCKEKFRSSLAKRSGLKTVLVLCARKI